MTAMLWKILLKSPVGRVYNIGSTYDFIYLN